MNNKTTIDWCDFRFKGTIGEVRGFFSKMFGDGLIGQKQNKGHHGFLNHEKVKNKKDVLLGLFAWGGESQKDWVLVSLNGDGVNGLCPVKLSEAIRELNGEYVRVDIALTTFDGSVRYQDVFKAYQDGKFDGRGRPPSIKEILTHGKGDTLYIGDRSGLKFARCYDKGLEMFSRFSAKGKSDLEAGLDVPLLGGKVQDIFRCEVVLKRDSKRSLPSDILLNRDMYFAGSYPYFKELLSTESLVIPSSKGDLEVDFISRLDHLKNQSSKMLVELVELYGREKAMDILIGKNNTGISLTGSVELIYQ